MKKLKSIFIVFLLASFLISCEDFMEQKPVALFDYSTITTADGIQKALVAAYAPLNGTQGLIDTPAQALLGNMHGGEAFKGSTAGDQPAFLEFSKFEVTPGNASILTMWRTYYDAVNRVNLVLAALPTVTGLSDAAKLKIEAEAKFLRGHYFFMLKRAFKNIPYIDENSASVSVPNYDSTGAYANAWPSIAADFDFARKNLSATDTDLGRPNKWAAACYYAKVLIYRANEGEYAAGYTEAKTVLTDVIANGVTNKGAKYDLLPNYHDNFDASIENGPESVFAIQHSANDGTSGVTTVSAPNGNMESLWFGSQNANAPGLGRGYGFYSPTQWFVDHFRTSGTGLPYLGMYNDNTTMLKNDYGLLSTQAFTPDTVGIDPRLDWTVGRRGIPLLDYGIMPGKDWIRDQTHAGPYTLAKWHIYKSQDGTYTNPGGRRNAINVCLIRFADVLLLAAECEARVGSLDLARTYVNRVRQRMVDNSTSAKNWVKTSAGANAANYRIKTYPTGGVNDPFQSQDKALDAILYERTLELGLEGHRFYDVVRFGKGATEFNAFLTSMSKIFDYLKGATYAESPDAYLPIPSTAIERSLYEGASTLKQNPGY